MDHGFHAEIDALWDHSDLPVSEQRFRNLIANDGSQGKDYVNAVKTQIARTLGLQRKFDEAHALLNEVEEALPELNHVVQARYYLERGRVLNSSGSPTEAVPLFEQALRSAELGGHDFSIVDAAHMLGIAASTSDRLGWNLRALKAAEVSADLRAQNWKGSLYNNIGWTYHDQGQYVIALDMFEKALAFRISQGNPANIKIARWCIGRCCRSLGRLAEALEIQQTLFRENPAENDPDPYVCEELGECLLALERGGEATVFFQDAYRQLQNDPWFVTNEPDRLNRLKELAQI